MKKLTPEAFMNERKVGAIFRAFAKRPEDIPGRIEMLNKLVSKARAATVCGRKLISRIDILVWANTSDYPGEADCGELAPALKEHFEDERKVFIHEVRTGDLFCSILNYGVAKQLRAGCDYSIIASSEANPYWESDIPAKLVQAACDDARAIGVAINELTEAVMEGRIANTLAMWHNESLMTVGGFDLRAAKPKNDKDARYVKGTDADGVERYYHLGGVEETTPLARLVDTFGPCIAPIESTSDELRYIIPDPKDDPEEWLRHRSKFGTKLERQTAHLALIGRDLSHLRGGVMPGYGWKKVAE